MRWAFSSPSDFKWNLLKKNISGKFLPSDLERQIQNCQKVDEVHGVILGLSSQPCFPKLFDLSFWVGLKKSVEITVKTRVKKLLSP